MDNKSYIIYAPAYSGSAGVRVLYRLRDTLAKSGFDAKIFCHSKKKNPKSPSDIFVSHPSAESRQKDIVIYPEVIVGNPLLFRNVVRFILNKPGFLGGETQFHNGEMLFSFDRYCHPSAPMLRLDMLDRDLFVDIKAPKTHNCCFVYKKYAKLPLKELEGCIDITMDWPKDRAELVRLLQTTDTLYSFDDNSCLLQEACLCGAKVKTYTPEGFKDYRFRDEFDAEQLKKQLDYFIDATQHMNYTGPVNKKGYLSIARFIPAYIAWHLLKAAYAVLRIPALQKKFLHIKQNIPHTIGGFYVR